MTYWSFKDIYQRQLSLSLRIETQLCQLKFFHLLKIPIMCSDCSYDFNMQIAVGDLRKFVPLSLFQAAVPTRPQHWRSSAKMHKNS